MVHTSHLRLAAVHLVDSHYCSDPAKFISVCLTSLTTMLQVHQLMLSVDLIIVVFFVQIALPHVNLLSKVDLVEKFGRLQFGLDYYTEVSILVHINTVLVHQFGRCLTLNIFLRLSLKMHSLPNTSSSTLH